MRLPPASASRSPEPSSCAVRTRRGYPATPGTLRLAECADWAALLGFAINFASAPFAATNGTDFANVPAEAQYYRSLTYGDLDSNNDSDVCIRRTDGVWCSTNNGSNAFTGYARRLRISERATGLAATAPAAHCSSQTSTATTEPICARGAATASTAPRTPATARPSTRRASARAVSTGAMPSATASTTLLRKHSLRQRRP